VKHRHPISQERDRARTGGWWCRSCGWTELDLDREQNVCVQCGRPTVKHVKPAGSTARMSENLAHELFEGMRQAIEKGTE
jgi:hypothetical protein